MLIATFAAHPALAVITGQYLFENDLLDTSPNARHGTGVNAPTFVSPGLYPGSNFALQLNTNGPSMANQTAAQAVSLPANTQFVTNAPGATLTAWVRLDGGSSNRTIIGINNGDTATSNGQGAARATLQVIDSSGNAQVRALGRRIDSGGSASANSGSNFLTIGQTYFLAGVFDYMNSAIRVYIDGVEVGSSSPSGWGALSANSANLVAEIGSVPTASASNQEYWPGLIDGARIFNTALTAEQIMGLYTNPDVVPNPFTPGDTDGDGVVELEDLTPIRQNYLQAVTMRTQGDLTGDNQVTFADFREWKTAILAGGGSLEGLDLRFAVVPEPSTILLVLWTGLGWIRHRARRATTAAAVTLALGALAASSAEAAISVTADPPVPVGANVGTVDPLTAASTGNIGLADVRMIRQTFKNAATFDVGTIVTAFDVTGGVGGFQISFYEVADVNADDWSGTGVAATPIHSLAFPGNLPGTTNRLQFNLSGPDVFNLPARDSGSEGYAVVFQTVDQVSNPGQFRHTNTAESDPDLYADGRHFTHQGQSNGGVRDLGFWLLGPDPNLPAPGDVNGIDGVTIADLEIIAANFRKNGNRSQGDLTGDGFIDLYDFRDWKSHYPGANSGSGGLADFEALLGVPEPSTGILACAALLAGGAATRRRLNRK